jgi:hypothetical protein
MSSFLTTIAQIQAAGLDIDKNTKIEVLQPHINASEKNFLLPVLGQSFFDALADDLEEDTPTAETTAVLPFLQKPVAWNAYYLFFRKPIGSLSHSGFYKKTFDHAQQPAKWEIDQLKEELICSADKALDELVAFLRENAADYPLWEDSDYFAKNKNLIIKSAQDFDQYVKIGCSSRVFQRLLFFREQAERNVKRTVCTDLYARITDELSGEIPLTPEVEALLPYLQPMVAFDTMQKAVMQVPFFRYGNDVMTWTYSDGTLTKNSITMAEAREMSGMYTSLYEDARNELLGFLNDNISDYPEYENSDCYSTAPRTLEVRYPNDVLKKHFGI